MNELHMAYSVKDPSHAGEVRRAALALASQLGFSAADAGRAGLAATEAATNIVKHARTGTVLVGPAPKLGPRPAVEIIALDRGPGMADVARCMEDGFSTAGGPGTGLGALSRLAAEMEIYSVPSRGTALLVRVLPQGSSLVVAPSSMVVGAVRVARAGEAVCGDAWALAETEGMTHLLLADGLGHGPAAAQAADAAVQAFDAASAEPLAEVFAAMHGALLPTRGAAVSVAEISHRGAELRFAGLGNVAGFLAWPGGSRHFVTQNGTLGVQLGQLRIGSYSLPPQGVLVLHSDGLNTHTTLDGYAGLLVHSPSLIAAVLFRDFVRGTDDATVVVARQAGTA